ncbi:MAG TPA: FeoA family protein [Desulfuromonadaceae bacterium]|nr:FeoA family protein [Desulfuromonadaceae bacterium]
MASPLTQPRETRLDRLQAGACGVVRRIESEDEDIQRLKTLGICIGRRVEIIKAGDPLIVRIFGSRLGISAELAERVWLDTCSSDHCALEASP